MIKKVEHIGVAVSDIESVSALFEKLLGKPRYKVESVESEAVSTAFFSVGETKIELLQATGDNSAIAKYIAKKGGGVHHIAFEVDDIEAEMERLKREGFEVINAAPKDGADNKRVCFLHPRSTAGMLVELCQEKK